MTWRELVFEICHKIPDEQFDDEAKIYLSNRMLGTAHTIKQHEGEVFMSNFNDGETPIIKQGEWTIE